ncbi:MAG: hypothetical protein J6O03_10650 [Butyrivibrio sp.]|nr:hypothetical protein [Butyrivibrio sp.]
MPMSNKDNKRIIALIAALSLCFSMLSGCGSKPDYDNQAPSPDPNEEVTEVVEAEEPNEEVTEDTETEKPYYLVDALCSQTAIDALGYDELVELVELVTTSVEPQAVNILADSFPCFSEAAGQDGLGKEISLYIYYENGDNDGIDEHEYAAPGALAYVNGGFCEEEDGSENYEYMICIDAKELCEFDDNGNPFFEVDDDTLAKLDTILCHELFHVFMDDYNRTGMTGFTDFATYYAAMEEQLSDEDYEELIGATSFPNWFIEGIAGCVGNIYQADIVYFNEYRYDCEKQDYTDTCTNDQLKFIYANQGYMEGTGDERYDLEASKEDNSDGHVNAATYVSGYMACLYLANLAYQKSEGSPAVVMDDNGRIESISGKKLREGLSIILSQMHEGYTFDEVIADISDGMYSDTEDFTKRFIKGNNNGDRTECEGDPESLKFCVGYLNYMQQLDELDPNTVPAGSVLFDNFDSVEETPLVKGLETESEVYRIAEQNTFIASTVKNEDLMDGGTSYTRKDGIEAVLEKVAATR